MSKIPQIKIPIKIINKTVRITKLKDDYFKGLHPNGIDVGYVKIGREVSPPTKGKRYQVQGKGFRDLFSTSPIVDIIDEEVTEIVIKTTYSTYKIEYLDISDHKVSDEDLKIIIDNWDD